MAPTFAAPCCRDSVVSALTAPLAYAAAVICGIDMWTAAAAVAFSLAVSFFEISQDLMRVRLLAFTVMKATIVRAILVSIFGVAVAAFARNGALLLLSSAIAYGLASVAIGRIGWAGTVFHYDRTRLLALAKAGIPFTASLVIYSLSAVIDRFIIAHIMGAASAGEYSAGADLVRQALIIPAISAAAAFCPLAVKIYANQGREAT